MSSVFLNPGSSLICNSEKEFCERCYSFDTKYVPLTLKLVSMGLMYCMNFSRMPSQ